MKRVQAAAGIVAESRIMLPVAILARMEAKPDKDAAVEAFLKRRVATRQRRARHTGVRRTENAAVQARNF